MKTVTLNLPSMPTKYTGHYSAWHITDPHYIVVEWVNEWINALSTDLEQGLHPILMPNFHNYEKGRGLFCVFYL